MQSTENRQIQDNDEVSLLDVMRFFSRNGKFIGLTTLGLLVSAITLSLLLSKQYQKQLTLLVRPIQLPLAQPFPGLDAYQVNTLAVELLQERPQNQITPDHIANDKISIKPKYNSTTQQLDITLRSPDLSFLSNAAPRVLSQLNSDFQDILSKTLQTNISSIALQIQRNQVTLAQMEQQIAQLKFSNLANSQGVRTVARLEALETQRVIYITTIATLKFDKQYLEQAQKNPAELAAKAISVQILTESEVRPTRSLQQVAIPAIVGSFIVAVLAAIIRHSVTRLQDELFKQKPKSSKEV